MDPSEISIEDVLKKWERYHPPPPSNAEADEKPWYQQPLPENSITNPRRRTRRNVAKNVNGSFSNDGVIGPKRFRVLPPVLDVDINNYKVSQCIKCQNRLQYHPIPSRTHLKSQTLSLFDLVSAGKSFVQSFGYCFVQNIVMAACYQSKDEMLLREINKKPNPVLLVCESKVDSFSALLVHMFCFAIGRVPYSVVQDDHVPSPLLRYLMKVFGFLFVSGDTDAVADKLLDLLRADNHVLVCMEENTASSQKLLYAVLNRLRNDVVLQKRVLLMPTAISTECDVNFENKSSSSWWDALRDWLFCRVPRGLVHFNISQSVNLPSLFTLADEMNHQKVENEENALIQRHIAFDLLETGAILPTHLLAFLFITKFRDSVGYEELKDSTEWLVKELRSMERFVGFSGNVSDILDHALDLMLEDKLIDIDISRNTVTVKRKCCNSLQKLFTKAKKIIHVFIVQAITASSIIASVGGRKELRQGSGYNVQCKYDKLLEKAENLSEMLSFLIDFSCPLNDMTNILMDSVEKMVTQDILQACSDIYESQTHQKLVHRFAMDAGWEEDQQDDDMAAMTTPTSSVQYSVSVHDEDVLRVLEFLQQCILPFLEVCFNVMALIREEYGRQEEFTAEMILDHLMKRFDSGFFIHGEMVSLNYVSRVLEYMFEKMIIDDVNDHFVLSEGYTSTGEMENFLQNISLFRQ